MASNSLRKKTCLNPEETRLVHQCLKQSSLSKPKFLPYSSSPLLGEPPMIRSLNAKFPTGKSRYCKKEKNPLYLTPNLQNSSHFRLVNSSSPSSSSSSLLSSPSSSYPMLEEHFTRSLEKFHKEIPTASKFNSTHHGSHPNCGVSFQPESSASFFCPPGKKSQISYNTIIHGIEDISTSINDHFSRSLSSLPPHQLSHILNKANKSSLLDSSSRRTVGRLSRKRKSPLLITLPPASLSRDALELTRKDYQPSAGLVSVVSSACTLPCSSSSTFSLVQNPLYRENCISPTHRSFSSGPNPATLSHSRHHLYKLPPSANLSSSLSSLSSCEEWMVPKSYLCSPTSRGSSPFPATMSPTETF
eukprot:Sdes_comp10294_c0_seq1m1927